MILNGWKEIANHVGRGIRTVQSWEQIGLPVRRPDQRRRSAVVAFSAEIDAWLNAKPQNKPVLLNSESTKIRPEGFRHRVLIVDDDEAVLITRAALLEQQGYEIRTARDGFEALASMTLAVPEIIVSDLRMPNMSGFELLAVVRKRFPSIGVIAMSGEFTAVTCPAILADAYIEKGAVPPGAIIEAVRELLSRSPVRSQPARPDSAPTWIPRGASGYIVVTCVSCLRSFSVLTRHVGIGETNTDPCVHCGQNVSYFVDETVAPFKAAHSELTNRSQRKTQALEDASHDGSQTIDDAKLGDAGSWVHVLSNDGTK